jgi:hypothetical protein
MTAIVATAQRLRAHMRVPYMREELREVGSSSCSSTIFLFRRSAAGRSELRAVGKLDRLETAVRAFEAAGRPLASPLVVVLDRRQMHTPEMSTVIELVRVR